MRSTCIEGLSVWTFGNTKILMINCININFCVTSQGSKSTSGYKSSPEVMEKWPQDILTPRHKCSNGLSAWIICILMTAKHNKVNK